MQDVGRYRILRQIGRGGMAEVFEAVAEGEGGFSRRVALKRCLPAEMASRRFREMFMAEARIASGLHHPNVVAVWDCGVVDDLPFQVMELVEGVDSAALLDRAGRLPAFVALHMAAEVARGLAHVHGALGPEGKPLGLVHRDVSPSNVLVSWEGEVKLADFGIVYAREGVGAGTEAGVTKGKAAFMSPEQATAGRLDGRSDLFGLACTLHTWLTGDSPLSAGEGMVGLLGGTPLPLDADLSEGVRALLSRSLQRDRAERLRDAAEFAVALDGLLQDLGEFDPAGRLRAWLSQQRPPEVPSTRGVGDLFSLDLVDSVHAGSDVSASIESSVSGDAVTAPPTLTVRRFTGIGPAGSSAPTVDSAGEAGSWLDVARWSRLRVGTFAIVIMGLGLLGWGWTEGARSPFPVAPAGTRPSVEPRSSNVVKQRTASPEPASPQPEAVKVDVPVSAPVEGADTARRAATTGRRSDAREGATKVPPRAVDETRPERQEPAFKGVVLVSGQGALRARIVVDGRPMGFAPRRFQLAAGKHRLELQAPGGRRWVRRIRVTARHTDSAPLRVHLPATAD